MSQAAPILQLKKVSKQFEQAGQTVTALQPTSFLVEPGQLIAILGPSGSGKSTFLTIAGLLQTPTQGHVVIDGQEAGRLSSKQRAQIRLSKIGFILQASNLVPFLTIHQQLELLDKVGHHQHDSKNKQTLLKTLGIHQLQDKYPTDLSGGERQRAAIAKALYGQHSLILADEPTASLDTKKAYEVVELLRQETIHQNRATIMVTHDERLIKYCTHVYRMEDGRLKADPEH